VEAVDPQLNVVAGAPPATRGQSASTGSTFYKASVDVTLPVIPGNVVVKVRRIFEKQNLSPWNWAIFYDDPLEIHPAPPFTVTGWVHTNDMLYTGHNTLTFASKVSFTKGWKIGFMPGDSAHAGETPRSPYYPKDAPPVKEQSHNPNGLDPVQIFNATSTNPNLTGEWRELIEMPASPAQTDPLAASRYYNQAGIKVTISSSGNITVLQQNGTAAGSNLKDAIENAITTGGSIQDNREGGSVRVATFDVSKIYNGGDYSSTASNSLGLQNFNGIIYITDTSASSSAKRAIRLKNGAKLANGGLTVVSQNPIYIQGDYNTGKTGSTNPPSNATTPDPTKPTVTGYNRQPAAIIADAVSVLSNNWDDSNSANLSARKATNTTVNAAIMAGIVRTGTVGNNYSGGVENFPRFLEDWGSSSWPAKSFTYYGSMVELYPSAQGTGIWQSNGGTVYNPPVRSWYFDTNFLATPPPGSLITTNYIKQKWYLE
jgi:hypothetical protein